MRIFFIIFLFFVIEYNILGQNLTELTFRKNLNDSIIESNKRFNKEHDRISIAIIYLNNIPIQLVSCNDLNNDSINNGCLMTWVTFSIIRNIPNDDNICNKFLSLPIAMDYKYQYADCDLYYKNHSLNYDEAIDYVIKILKELYDVKHFNYLSIKIDGYDSE